MTQDASAAPWVKRLRVRSDPKHENALPSPMIWKQAGRGVWVWGNRRQQTVDNIAKSVLFYIPDITVVRVQLRLVHMP
jgi:hypothetical protein